MSRPAALDFILLPVQKRTIIVPRSRRKTGRRNSRDNRARLGSDPSDAVSGHDWSWLRFDAVWLYKGGYRAIHGPIGTWPDATSMMMLVSSLLAGAIADKTSLSNAVSATRVKNAYLLRMKIESNKSANQ